MLFFLLMRLSYPTTARAPSVQKRTTLMNAQKPTFAKSYSLQHSTTQRTYKPNAIFYTHSSNMNTAQNSPTSRHFFTPEVTRALGSPPKQRKCTPSTKRSSSSKMCLITSPTPAFATHSQWTAACARPLAISQQNACPSSTQLNSVIPPSAKRPTDPPVVLFNRSCAAATERN